MSTVPKNDGCIARGAYLGRRKASTRSSNVRHGSGRRAINFLRRYGVGLAISGVGAGAARAGSSRVMIGSGGGLKDASVSPRRVATIRLLTSTGSKWRRRRGARRPRQRPRRAPEWRGWQSSESARERSARRTRRGGGRPARAGRGRRRELATATGAWWTRVVEEEEERESCDPEV